MDDRQQRRRGATTLGFLFLAMAIAGVVAAVSTAVGWWPLAWGRFLAGDFVTMGPAALVLAAVAYASAGFGLLRQRNWGRRLAIVLAALNLYFVIPEISGAVIGLRIGGIAENGARIILYVVVIWCLLQPAQTFDTRSRVIPE